MGDCFAEEKQESLAGSLDISTSVSCSDIDRRYVEKFLQFSVKKDFVRATGFQDTVTASCDPSTGNLNVTIELTGNAGQVWL